jgi:ribose 5-phosphate isomerase B
MKISIGSDHAGFEYKEAIIAHLKNAGHEVVDFGTYSSDSTDYPLYVIPAAEAVVRKEVDFGIVLGGSGNGEAIAANKVRGVRCGLCWNHETARLNRQHNNGNVLSLGQRMIPLTLALEIVDIWLNTPFEGGRHERRVAELDAYEAGGSHKGMMAVFERKSSL